MIVASRKRILLPLGDCSTFLEDLLDAVPFKTHKVLTDNGILLTFPPCYEDGRPARYMTHLFDARRRENGIEQRVAKVRQPRTNRQVERMN